MVRKQAGSVIALLFLSSIAVAQQSNAVRVRGTIESKDHQPSHVKARGGETLKVKLADNAPVRAVVKAPLSDVKPGSFVGITAMPQPDGTQKAVEIHIFLEAMRGTGEGHRPWDLLPNSTMTNATVATEVASSNGKTLALKYKDGEKRLSFHRTLLWSPSHQPRTSSPVKRSSQAAREPEGGWRVRIRRAL